MVFGKIIGIIINAAFPINKKITLFDAIAHPIKTHIDCFRAALFDSRVDDAGCASVVGLDGGGRLRMAQVFEDRAQHGAVFGIEKECAEFSFSCRGKDRLHDGAVDQDRAIEGGRRLVG